MELRRYIFCLNTVHTPICQPRFVDTFLGNEKVTNRVRGGFQKTKSKFVSHDD